MAFFQDAKPAREPFLRAPAAVIGLIAVLIVAHVVRVLVPEALSNEMLEVGALIPARYDADIWAALGRAPVSFWDGAFPFVGYQFLHADFLHLGMNCLWLLVAGTPVARRVGALRFLVLFFVCGIIAGAVLVAASWGAFAVAAGASGAVSGMMAAAIRVFYGERMAAQAVSAGGNVHHMVPPLAPLRSGPVLLFSALWCVVNVVVGVLGIGVEGTMHVIAWEAHIGGYFAGLFLIGLFDVRRRMPAAT